MDIALLSDVVDPFDHGDPMERTHPPPPHRPKTSQQRHGSRRLELLISAADGVRVVELVAGTSPVIGRTTDADIVIQDPSISRRHARLHVGAGRVTIEDLGSLNGVVVGGVTVPPNTVVPVELEVAFHVASATLLVQRAKERHGSGRGANVLDLAGFADQGTAPEGRVVVAPMMHRLYSVLDVVAPTSLSVLILGETGVGKEGIAETLHERSPRASAKCVKLNCAALPESLLEAELFGYEKGAFTGATTSKPGLFEAASGGTVFLDEIGEISLATQVKLLRVLECGEVLRMGSITARKIDVRYVAATNRNLKQLIAAGQFRADLFFRLNGVTLYVPPLRDRKEEVEPLSMHFAQLAAARIGRPPPVFDESARRALHAYSWPGNVRELRNVVERAVALSNGQPITASHFLLDTATPEAFDNDAPLGTSQLDAPEELKTLRSSPPGPFSPREQPVLPPPPSVPAWTPPTTSSSAPAPPLAEEAGTAKLAGPPPVLPPAPTEPSATQPRGDFKAEMRALERQRIIEALERNAGNQSRAAKELSISRHTLMQRLELYGIARPRKRR